MIEEIKVCNKCKGCGYTEMSVDVIEYVIRGMKHSFPGRVETSLCSKCDGIGKVGCVDELFKG